MARRGRGAAPYGPGLPPTGHAKPEQTLRILGPTRLWALRVSVHLRYPPAQPSMECWRCVRRGRPFVASRTGHGAQERGLGGGWGGGEGSVVSEHAAPPPHPGPLPHEVTEGTAGLRPGVSVGADGRRRDSFVDGRLWGSICRARAVRARCGYWGFSIDPFIQSQSGGMVTPQSPAGTIYNSSPGRQLLSR